MLCLAHLGAQQVLAVTIVGTVGIGISSFVREGGGGLGASGAPS